MASETVRVAVRSMLAQYRFQGGIESAPLEPDSVIGQCSDCGELLEVFDISGKEFTTALDPFAQHRKEHELRTNTLSRDALLAEIARRLRGGPESPLTELLIRALERKLPAGNEETAQAWLRTPCLHNLNDASDCVGETHPDLCPRHHLLAALRRITRATT